MKKYTNIPFFTVMVSTMLLFSACDKDSTEIIDIKLPDVTTSPATDVTDFSAVLHGTLNSEGSASVTERGFVWSATSQLPSLSDNKIVSSGGSGNFTATLSGLNEFTVYYVRAYATSKEGTGYGVNTEFRTLQKAIDVTCEKTITDADGNTYQVVKIGSQCWTESNLKTSKYNNGMAIEHLTENEAWANTTFGAWCYYKNTADSAIYGKLYNWYAAQSGNLCPEGWRVPTDKDVKKLADFIGNPGAAAIKSVSGWPEGLNGTNSSGFNLYPAGDRFAGNGFTNLGKAAFMWTSNEYSTDNGFIYSIAGTIANFTQMNQKKNTGACIRCVRN